MDDIPTFVFDKAAAYQRAGHSMSQDPHALGSSFTATQARPKTTGGIQTENAYPCYRLPRPNTSCGGVVPRPLQGSRSTTSGIGFTAFDTIKSAHDSKLNRKGHNMRMNKVSKDAHNTLLISIDPQEKGNCASISSPIKTKPHLTLAKALSINAAQYRHQQGLDDHPPKFLHPDRSKRAHQPTNVSAHFDSFQAQKKIGEFGRRRQTPLLKSSASSSAKSSMARLKMNSAKMKNSKPKFAKSVTAAKQSCRSEYRERKLRFMAVYGGTGRIVDRVSVGLGSIFYLFI